MNKITSILIFIIWGPISRYIEELFSLQKARHMHTYVVNKSFLNLVHNL